MHILIDIQACQGENGSRGIGRYSLLLSAAVAKESTSRGHYVSLLLNDRFPETMPAILKMFDGIRPDAVNIFSIEGPIAESNSNNSGRAKIAIEAREKLIINLEPDILLVSSLFEGWADDVAISVHKDNQKFLTAIVFYDLIPFIFSDLYLNDPNYRIHYLERIKYLKNADLLLAISNHSRIDVIERLGYDASKVFNIYGAASRIFHKNNYDKKKISQILTSYGIKKPFIFYVPGGFDERKNFSRLFKAFAMLPFDLRTNYQLVIAGKVPLGIHGYITNLLSQEGLLNEDLVLTGYIKDDDLVALYNLCKLFVYPSLYEGLGLPILEAMSCCAPVIASNVSSMPEVVGRMDSLFDPLSADSIANLLKKGLLDSDFEESLRSYSALQSNKFTWEKSAKLVIDAFESCFKPQHHAFRKLANMPDLHTNKNANKKMFFVDISNIIKLDPKTGIQRVVRSILWCLLNNPPSEYQIKPIYFKNNEGFFYANQYKNQLMGDERNNNTIDFPINYSKGDIFLGLDLTADLFPEICSVLNDLKTEGVKIYYVVYDLIPLRYSWHASEMRTAFNCWIKGIALYADSLLCISNSTAIDLKNWFIDNPDLKCLPSIRYFHLGADVKKSLPTDGLPENAEDILDVLAKNPSFLMVGTLEPRKGHNQTLEAFEELWASGHEINLIIIGQNGWGVDNLITKLKMHPELGKRLYLLTSASDEFLMLIYQSASALIIASEAEGFGLPLIEAAHYDLPIIARNLPVFRELAEDFALYFNGTNPIDITNAVKEWLLLKKNNKVPSSKNISWLTWEQSVEALLNIIIQEQ
jgi:glycosyltransferase involved in cell wall biosynthesis